MESNRSIPPEISNLMNIISSWADTESGKKHGQFILALFITLQHSSGMIPNVELKEGKGLMILWPKGDKQYGVLLSNQGSVLNICKEKDGRIFASTKLNEDSN